MNKYTKQKYDTKAINMIEQNLRLCNADPEPQQTMYIDDSNKVNWMAISGGKHHTLSLSSDNKLYSWGFGQCGQLGQSPQTISDITLKIFQIDHTSIEN